MRREAQGGMNTSTMTSDQPNGREIDLLTQNLWNT